MLHLGSRQRVASGAAIFKLGGPADSLFVVERGRVALTLPLQVCGREEDVLIEERAAGETVGWSALIPPHRFTLNAIAQVDSDVLVIRSDALLTHLRAHPDVGFTIARNVAEIVGQRLQVFQAMWLRQIQRVVELRTMPAWVQA